MDNSHLKLISSAEFEALLSSKLPQSPKSRSSGRATDGVDISRSHESSRATTYARSYYSHKLSKRVFSAFQRFCQQSRTNSVLNREREERQQRIDDFISKLAEARSANAADKESLDVQEEKQVRRLSENRGTSKRSSRSSIAAEPQRKPAKSHKSSRIVESKRTVSPSPPPYDDAPPSPLKQSTLPTPEAPPDYTSLATASATGPISSEERKQRMRMMRERAMQRVQEKKMKQHNELKNKAHEEELALKELNEKHRLEQQRLKEQSTLSKQQLEVMRAKIHKAKSHYVGCLLTRHFSNWIRLITEARLDNVKAYNHYNDYLLMHAWEMIKEHSYIRRRDRYRREIGLSNRAYAHYKQELCRRVWKKWSNYQRILASKAIAIKSQVCRFSVTSFAFRAWRIAQEKLRRIELRKVRHFRSLHDAATLKYCWNRWRDYLVEVEMEAEVKNRVDATWSKLQRWMK